MLVPSMGTNGGNSRNRSTEQMFLPTRKEEGRQKLPIWEELGGVQRYARKALPTLGEWFPLYVNPSR